MKRKIKIVLGVFLSMSMMACITTRGSSRQVERVSADSQTDLSGNWNDTDARMVSDALLRDCFASAWIQNFVQEEGRKPAIRVRSIVNKTDEHIDSQVFIKNIERAVINSGKARVLAQKGAELGAVEEEQDRAVSGRLSDDSSVRVGNETGADYVVSVRITSILDQIRGKQAKLYKVNMEMLHSSTGEKVWIGDHEIKKVVSQSRVRW